MTNRTIEERCDFRTQRLAVRGWTSRVKELQSEKDFAEKVIEILTPNVTKALPDGWQNISTIVKAQEWIKERNEESHFVTIELLSTHETIGFIFLNESDSEHNYYDLRFGYLLSENVWGKGLGTELVKGLIQWCKKEGDIKSISGGVETDNIGSIKVLEKAGFSVSTLDKTTEQVIFYEYKFNIDKSYDAVYSKSENLFGHPYQELQDYFKTFQKKGSILDLGCGQGRDSFYLSSLGFKVTAVDNSSIGIRQMNKKSKELELDIQGLVADVFEFEPKDRFDIILFDMLLHSFNRSEQKKLLHKYADSLEANGIFCIVYPEDLNSNHFMEIFEELEGAWELENKTIIHDVPMLVKDIEFKFEMIIIRNNGLQECL